MDEGLKTTAEIAQRVVTDWLDHFDPPPQINFQQSDALQYLIDNEIAYERAAREKAEAALAAASLPASSESEAEHFIQQAVDRSPEPLRRLGEWLSKVLDKDDWKTAERLLLGASLPASQAGGWQDIATAPCDGRPIWTLPKRKRKPTRLWAHPEWKATEALKHYTHWHPDSVTLPAPPSAPTGEELCNRAEFSIGDPVEKFTGEARWHGVVRAVYLTGKGSLRYVVEVEPQGFQMIAVPAQLRALTKTGGAGDA